MVEELDTDTVPSAIAECDNVAPAVAKDILVGLKKYFEEYHTAKITKNAIEAAVDLSVRYQTDKRLPDKAIDLIDSACAKQRLLNRSNFTINKPNILETYRLRL